MEPGGPSFLLLPFLLLSSSLLFLSLLNAGNYGEMQGHGGRIAVIIAAIVGKHGGQTGHCGGWGVIILVVNGLMAIVEVVTVTDDNYGET